MRSRACPMETGGDGLLKFLWYWANKSTRRPTSCCCWVRSVALLSRGQRRGRTRDQPSLEPAGVMHDPDELLLTHLAVPVAVHLLRVALFVTKPREIRTGTANPGASAFSLPSRSRPKVNAYMTTLVLFILLLPRSCDGSRPRPAARARHCTPCGASLR